ncbi:MAG: hypothetical protein CFE45_08070 [Burkholderiales bacterium PBB5]|nr:MAG: hypothetical protein CFE45_08070 [Burkholderiales bacterium PBB5]
METPLLVALRNLRIGTRITGLTSLLLAVAGLGARELSRINDNVVDMADSWLPSVQALGEVRALANSARRTDFRHVLSDDAKQRTDLEARHQDIAVNKMPAALKVYSGLLSSPEETALYEAIVRQWNAYLAGANKILTASGQGPEGQARARTLITGESNQQSASLRP